MKVFANAAKLKSCLGWALGIFVAAAVVFFAARLVFLFSLGGVKISVWNNSYGCIVSFAGNFEEETVYRGNLKSKNSFLRIDYGDGSFLEDYSDKEFPEPALMNFAERGECRSFTKKLDEASRLRLKSLLRGIFFDLVWSKISICPEPVVENPVKIKIRACGVNFDFLIDGGHVYDSKLRRAQNVENLYLFLREISPEPVGADCAGEAGGKTLNAEGEAGGSKSNLHYHILEPYFPAGMRYYEFFKNKDGELVFDEYLGRDFRLHKLLKNKSLAGDGLRYVEKVGECLEFKEDKGKTAAIFAGKLNYIDSTIVLILKLNPETKKHEIDEVLCVEDHHTPPYVVRKNKDKNFVMKKYGDTCFFEVVLKDTTQAIDDEDLRRRRGSEIKLRLSFGRRSAIFKELGDDAFQSVACDNWYFIR